MQAPSQPSRTPSFASTADSISSQHQNAALAGAARAFGRATPRTEAPSTNYSGENGALAAASTVGTLGTSSQHGIPTQSMLRPHPTGESVQSVKSNATGYRSSLGSSPLPNLSASQGSSTAHVDSPSRQAATLAAARFSKPETKSSDTSTIRRATTISRPAVAPKPRRLSSYKALTEGNEEKRPTDDSSIPPTTSLVDLFERKSSTAGSGSKPLRPAPIVIKSASDLAIKSPKPVRTSGGITSMLQMEVEKSKSSSRTRSQRPTPQLPRRRSSSAHYASASEELPEPSPPTIRKPALFSPEEYRDGEHSSRRPSTSAAISIPTRSAGNVLTRADTLSPSSAKSIPAQFHQLYPTRRMTPSMTDDQLANAMVAGSLASSRVGSPRKPELPPPPTRRPKHSSTWAFSRTPSPAKGGMRHTLRKEETDSSDSDDDDNLHPYGKHKKKRLVRKHPNKHHEGDRKRWRDAVTERERKRYEGVWAANKGIYYSFTPDEWVEFRRSASRLKAAKDAAAEQVSNIAARDIWNRSRLPEAVLENVWDLVDNDGVGRLGKEEFVVGLWLIDQRLKGRKLPVRVGETVWASVRGLQGVKIKK